MAGFEVALTGRFWVAPDISSFARVAQDLVIHRTGQYENNRAEASHQPTRQQERQMRQFKSPGQAQRFLAAMPRYKTRPEWVVTISRQSIICCFGVSS